MAFSGCDHHNGSGLEGNGLPFNLELGATLKDDVVLMVVVRMRDLGCWELSEHRSHADLNGRVIPVPADEVA